MAIFAAGSNGSLNSFTLLKVDFLSGTLHPKTQTKQNTSFHVGVWF